MRRRARALVLVFSLLALATVVSSTPFPRAARVTSPREFLGAAVGDDYFLATYAQLEAYWQRLDRESDRLSLVDIGRTTEERTQWMAVVTAPENAEHLSRYREISRTLALGDASSDTAALALAAEGRAVVWIDGGLHATETLGAQQLIETAYRLVSGSDAETTRILRDVIVLLVHANPDGHELVANWYMRNRDPFARSLDGLPSLDHRYAGHDNNRDFYAATQAETRNMNRVMYAEWFPQIVYDHHQSDVPGAVMFAPPFAGPSNPLFDPLIASGIDLAGAAIHARLAAEGKRGVTMRSGSPYSTWWNGGLRTTAYFHNQVGLLSETVGGPAPMQAPIRSPRAIPRKDLPLPLERLQWRFRDALEYVVSANLAVLDAASRHRERWLHNAYVMARNSIEQGRRDAAAYILPADQPDFPTATKFVNALMSAGIAVQRATGPFVAGGREYPAGSFLVGTAQAFRPHVLDMFEPQSYLDEVPEADGTPDSPYDIAGWTLALQMGVAFDRVTGDIDGPFETVRQSARPAGGSISGPPSPAAYVLNPAQNDSTIAVNRLLEAGVPVFRLDEGVEGAAGTGAIYADATPASTAIVGEAVAELGLTVAGVDRPVYGSAQRLRQPRIALVDRYGGWSSSGWLRWILERFEYPFEVVYPPVLNVPDLAERYDVVILPSEAVPVRGAARSRAAWPTVPPEHHDRLGDVTTAVTVPALKRFVERGGTLIAIGRSASIGYALGLPLENPLTTRQPDGTEWPLPSSQYSVPGSILRAAVNARSPLADGFGEDVDVFFNNGPVFRLGPTAHRDGIRAVAWFGAAPLRSGWARGQERLRQAAAVVDAPLGAGHVLLSGPEITFRAQSHGTFRFLFNGIARAASEHAPLVASNRGSRP